MSDFSARYDALMRRVQRGREEGDATSQGAFPAPHSFRAYGDAGGGSGGVPEFGNNYGIGNSNGVGDGAHNFGSGNGSETNGYSYGYPEFSRIGHYRDAEASSFVTALSSHGSDAFGTAGASNSHANEFGFGHRPASPQFKFETFHLDDVGPLFGAKAKLVKEEVKEPVQGPFSVPDSSDRSGSDAPVAVTVKDVPDPDAKPAISKPGASSHDKAKPNLSVKVKAEDGKPDVAPRPVPKRFPWDDALATTTDTKPDTKPDTGPIAPPRSKTPSAEFDADDAWISAAVAQVTKVEAENLPPPGPSRSPYFPLAAAQAAKVQAQAPTRPASTSTAAFPKRPNSTSKPATGEGGYASIPEYEHIPARSPVECVRPSSTADPASPAQGDVSASASASAPAPVLHTPRFNPDDLVPVMALDTVEERNVFSFRHFNAMQSAIFQAAYNGAENLVVTAPTSSGKTTVFELAFLQMMKAKQLGRDPLAIYIAPTKALVGERVRDWRKRFSALPSFDLVEVTGDPSTTPYMGKLKTVDLMITTPEKLDSITRKPSGKLMERLKLVMIDEVHILQEDRGPTLEVLVSRIKARATCRIVAVSASVPNMEDVARWIGSNKPSTVSAQEYDNVKDMPQATVFKFSEEFRPVPLTSHIVTGDAMNDFALGVKFDKDLWGVVNRYGSGKPTLIFCPTRKSCSAAAEQLYKDYGAAQNSGMGLPWHPRKNKPNGIPLKDEKIQTLTKHGIAVHHAGLEVSDRRAIESAFIDGALHCLVATSTLAVGVNLPAHLVIIKGTSMWQGSGFRDYSDVDIQQMMGRAGRPQYDQSGTVVLMCGRNKQAQFSNILNSRMVLESRLHMHLTEHINSEIGLGTITDLKSGQAWLHGTFLAIRLKQNPRHYISAVVKDHTRSWKETLDRYVENAVTDLAKYTLVETVQRGGEGSGDGPEREELGPTHLGKVMSKNFISYPTMRSILRMSETASVQELLQILAGAAEFSALRIRQGEGALLNKLRMHPDIRYHLDSNVKSYGDKVFLHMQVTFGNVLLDQVSTKTENASPLQTQFTIFQSAPRITKAILLVAVEKKYGVAVRSALELLHTVNGKSWEDHANVFRQIPRLGPKSLAVLAANGITSFDDFCQLESGRLEMWFNRNPPYGFQLIQWAKSLPRFYLDFKEVKLVQFETEYPCLTLAVTVSWRGALRQFENKLFGKIDMKGGDEVVTPAKGKGYTVTLAFISSKDRFLAAVTILSETILQKSFNDTFEIDVTLEEPDETVLVTIGADELSGLSNTFEYRPSIDPSAFPRKPPQALFEKLNKFEMDISNDEAEAEPKSANGNGKAKAKGKGKVKEEPLFLPQDDDAMSLDEPDTEVEELIDLTVPIKKRSNSAATPIDLTSPVRKRSGRRSEGDSRAGPSRKKSKTRPGVSRFIDDEAAESDADGEGSKEPNDSDNAFINDGDDVYGDVDGTHGDDTMSVDSFGEFDSIFEINTPPPSKRDRKGKGKAKEKVKKESEVKRQRLRKRNRRDSTPIDLLPLAGPSKPVPLPTSPTASSRMKREPDPNSTLSPLAALPIPNADHHPHSAVRFNPATGRLRQTFFKRTPSTDKEGSIPTADGPHTTLALSRPASTNPMRFPSPSPIFYNHETTEPPPPSGLADDFDEWMKGLIQ